MVRASELKLILGLAKKKLTTSYLTIIKKPMDLSTAQAKLSSGQYTTRQDFVKDIRLIVSNCILYNGSQSTLGHAAKQFESMFNKRTSSQLVPRDLDMC
jgi:hypothetical protein